MKIVIPRILKAFLLAMSSALTLFAQTVAPTPSQTSPPNSMQAHRQQAWHILEMGVIDKSTDKRTQAVRALGLIKGDSNALEIAESALRDAKPEVRAAAATSLGVMGSRSCIPKLEEELTDKDASVVLAAAHALWTFKDPAAYDVYYTILTGQRKIGEGVITEGMNTFKDPKKAALFGFEEGIGFIPFAGLGVSAAKALLKDDASLVRAAAAEVLATDSDPSTSQALVDAISDKSWIVRAAALDAIGKRGDPKLMNDIVPAMSDQKDGVRYAAAAAVIRLSEISDSAKTTKKTAPKPARKGSKAPKEK